MGQTTSCTLNNTILKHQSIKTSDADPLCSSQDPSSQLSPSYPHKKQTPLKYIHPIKFGGQTLIPETDTFMDRVPLINQEKQPPKPPLQQISNMVSEDHQPENLSQQEETEQMNQNTFNIVKVKWNKFIKMKNRNFQDDYQIINEIGRGGFGCVYKVIMKNGNIQRAAKKIKKNKLKKDQHQNLLAEMAIMMSLDHPNITKLFQVYDQRNYYIMVMQLCDGGQLFQKIVNKTIKQSQARIITDQLLNALNYIHQKRIIHRDIKPQNILIQRNTQLVKIIDFGISKRYVPGQFQTARVGTPYYIAPEVDLDLLQVLMRKYDSKCDIWSLGVILYMIVYNYPPFKGSNVEEVMENILKKQIIYKKNPKIKFSQSCLSFIQSLLNKDPKNRPNAKQALQSPWLKHPKQPKSHLLLTNTKKPTDKKQVFDRITNFHFKNKLQAVVHTYIVSQLLTSQERIELLDVFRELDANKNGLIDSQEIKNALVTRNFTCLQQQKIQKIFAYIDTNCSGQIDYTQFLVAAIDFDNIITNKHFQQAFAYFDIDNSGQITFEEVVKFLQNQIESTQEIKQLFKSVDKNGDGIISKVQFVELLVREKKERMEERVKNTENADRSTKITKSGKSCKASKGGA